jgi:transcriptional regulator of acetoin/glycerol metabolism
VTEAAKRLGMDRGYLHRKIKRYGLVRDAQT